MGLDMYVEALVPIATGSEAAQVLDLVKVKWFEEEDGSVSTYLNGSEWSKPEVREAANALEKALGITVPKYSSTIVYRIGDGYRAEPPVAYWRKANAIHRWFVEHVQDGVDECQTSRALNFEELVDLADTCRVVLDQPSKAADLLPVQGGFFFGSTNYDEYYYEDVKSTIEQLTRLVALPGLRKPGVTLHYRASW